MSVPSKVAHSNIKYTEVLLKAHGSHILGAFLCVREEFT